MQKIVSIHVKAVKFGRTENCPGILLSSPSGCFFFFFFPTVYSLRIFNQARTRWLVLNGTKNQNLNAYENYLERFSEILILEFHFQYHWSRVRTGISIVV